jgi:ATP-dependent helicase/nuclease subunit A
VPQDMQASAEAAVGLAMHRLLELYAPGTDLAALAPSVGAQFQLDTPQCARALQLAQRITQGEAAWVWDSGVIDWQANEVELVHDAQLLRLDRLVRQRDSQTWWVLDYKSPFAPQQQADLREQLQRYAQAVRAVQAGSQVRAAFITGEGKLVEL